MFTPQLSLRQWLWCAWYLRECMPGRFETNMRALVHMAQYSRATLQGMRAELGIEYSHLERGILAFYRDPRELEHARHSAAMMRELEVRSEERSVGHECVQPSRSRWSTC